MNEAELAVLHRLSELLYSSKSSLSSEKHYPSRTSDASDDYIARMKIRVEKLAEVRAELEDLFTERG